MLLTPLIFVNVGPLLFFALLLNGAAVVYKSSTQTPTALSATEADFFAAVAAAKAVIFVRSLLTDLGFPPSGPTKLYEDNEACINIVNNDILTPRSKHIDTRWFRVQEWASRGDIIMHKIPGIINSSDGLTKPNGWVLHHRHARRIMIMGHYRD